MKGTLSNLRNESLLEHDLHVTIRCTNCCQAGFKLILTVFHDEKTQPFYSPINKESIQFSHKSSKSREVLDGIELPP